MLFAFLKLHCFTSGAQDILQQVITFLLPIFNMEQRVLMQNTDKGDNHCG
jgi:hypothetical protein